MIDHIFRRKAILTAHKYKNTGLIPLSHVKSAAVYLKHDAGSDWVECIAAINNFFCNLKIHVTIYVILRKNEATSDTVFTPDTVYGNTVFINKEDTNWFGLVQDHILSEKISDNADLAISLSPNCYTADYCIASTKALFRIGAKQEAVNLYDMVISTPKNKVMTQLDTFNAITGMLPKIK